MPRYTVGYSTNVEFTVELEAESAEAAEAAVQQDGKYAEGMIDWSAEGESSQNTIHYVDEVEEE